MDRKRIASGRMRLTDSQRRRLAVKGKLLGQKLLATVAGIVTPDTILGGITHDYSLAA